MAKGFLLYSIDDGHVPPFEYLPCGAIQPKIGLALTESSGNLAVASGTTKPSYICMTERSAAVAAGTRIPVIRVTGDIIFDVPSSESMSARKIGDKVTIYSDGMKVTATTTSGVAEIVGIEDTASGGHIQVRF